MKYRCIMIQHVDRKAINELKRTIEFFKSLIKGESK